MMATGDSPEWFRSSAASGCRPGSADVLVPEVGPGGDEFAHHSHALFGLQINNFDAVLLQPVLPAEEVHRLADDDGADVELPHQPAAKPAGRERGDHDGVAVAAPHAAGLAE